MNTSEKGCQVERIGSLRSVTEQIYDSVSGIERIQIELRGGLNILRETKEDDLECFPSEKQMVVGIEGELDSLANRLRFIARSLSQDLEKLYGIVR